MHESQRFLALLNADTATPRHWLAMLPVDERELWTFWPGQSAEAGKLLRRYIGAWINSGFQEDGTEVPGNRNYATGDCFEAIKTLAELLNCHPEMRQGPPFQTLFALRSRNEKKMPERGVLAVMFNPRGGLQAKPIVFRDHLRPEELAAFGFLIFWQSPLLFKVMRCKRCDVFEIPERKIRERYERGWHCKKCAKTAAAIAATTKARNTFRDTWFGHAVDGYRNLERHPRHANLDRVKRVKFITQWVKDRLPTGDTIKRNTISLNLSKIQAAAEGEQNAKS